MVPWHIHRLRILKKMRAFRAIPEDGPSYIPNLTIPDGQTALGVYENVPNAMSECVVVTDKALCVERNGEFMELKFDEMVSVDWFPESKRQANSLAIRMQDGIVRYVPVRGRQDGGADVFEFVRFVSRSIGDFRLIREERAHVRFGS